MAKQKNLDARKHRLEDAKAESSAQLFKDFERKYGPCRCDSCGDRW